MLKCGKGSLMVLTKEKKLFELENKIELCGNFEEIIEKMIHLEDYSSLINRDLTITIDPATNERFLSTYFACQNQRPNNTVLIKGIFEIMAPPFNFYKVTFPYLSINEVFMISEDTVLIHCVITNSNNSKPSIVKQ